MNSSSVQSQPSFGTYGEIPGHFGEPPTFVAGDIVNEQFTISKRIHGGSEDSRSLVYLADDGSREVALKMFRIACKNDFVRAQRETIVQDSLVEQGALPIIARGYIGDSKDQPFIATPYMPNGTLNRQNLHLIDNPIIMIERLVRGLQRPVQVVRAMHEKEGLVYRDFKPDNIVVDDNGDGSPIDFGIVAKSGEPNAEQKVEQTFGTSKVFFHRLTKHNGILGTPAYIDLFSLSGNQVCPANDIYSIGATIYELTTGRLASDPSDTRPYVPPNLTNLQDNEFPPDKDLIHPRAFNSDIPRELASLAIRCLGDPERRPDAEEVEVKLLALA